MNEIKQSLRTWHWQIDELEEGPNYEFLASFDPADAELLHAFVREHLPDAYTAYEVDPRPRHRAASTLYSSYLDRHTHARLLEMAASGARQSIWHHGEIEVFDEHVGIKHVLSGGMFDDTAFVLRLAETPSLKMKSWVIGYNGYEWAEVARGQCGDELIRYLEVRTPNEPMLPLLAPRPPAGADVDERRTVSLLRSKPEHAAAFAFDNFTIWIARERLHAIAHSAPASWATEAERLALIAGGRARKLLMAAEAQVPPPSDTHHLLLQLCERGSLHITRSPGEKIVTCAHIHYYGHRSAPAVGRGFITVSETAITPAFLHIDWWVS